MIYYLLNSGNDRFDLINNYDFERLYEVLRLIDEENTDKQISTKIHEKPIKMFAEAFEKSNPSEDKDKVIDRLKKGQYPISNPEQAYQAVNNWSLFC